MDPILAEIYGTVLPSAPYLIAAYAFLWVALLIYVIIIAVGTRKANRQVELLEEELRIRDERLPEEMIGRR